MRSPNMTQSAGSVLRLPILIATALSACFFALAVHAESYPTRAIRVIVPYPAGGTSDLLARVLAQKMSDSMGQPIVIENIGGAAGTTGAASAAKAEPDGYTLLFGYATQFTMAPALYRKLAYDPVTSFAPIGGVVRFHFLITAYSAMPFNTLSELVSYAKSKPGELTYASPGIGTATHLIGELLKNSQGVDLVHVPYRGGGPAINDYVAGRINVYWDAVAPLTPWVEKGTIKPLAVSSAERIPGLPNVPTVLEAGMPDLNVFTWTALFAPARTPSEIRTKLETELNKVLQDKEVQSLFEKNGYEMFPKSPAAITELIQKDLAKWRALVEATGIKMD
jgi:tripartite-type tricarboxylate transporter receptor subunit TctC